LDGILLFGDDGIPFRSMVGKDRSFLLDFFLLLLITWDGSNGPFDLEFPALKCLVVQTNDDCLVGEVSSSVV
jgi:hypothetical protein